MRAFALSYCILFSPVWLLSFGGLLFSEKETEDLDLGEKRGKETGRSRGRGNFVLDILCERRIYLQKK